MTYPPQEPGNQPSSEPPSGGGQSQPGSPQQPGYGPPPPGYGAPQQGYGTARQPKRRTGLIVGIVVGVVAALAIAGVLAFVLTGSESASPRAVGDTFMSAVKDQNVDRARNVSCKDGADKLTGVNDGMKLPSEVSLRTFEYNFVSDDTNNDSKHTVTYKADITAQVKGKEEKATTTFKLGVVKENDDWKVCTFDTD